MADVTIINADVIEGLRSIPDHSVHCVITSPPYMALRSYGLPPRDWSDGLSCVLGEEPSLHDYIKHLVEVFGELKRVLHPTGTFWLNLGDSYQHNGPQPSTGLHKRNGVPLPETYRRKPLFASKKQLGMVPARVALALQDDGWILRQDIIWAKGLSFCPTYSGSVMPESIQDRAVWAHEHLFHFAVQDKYFYDIDGCREPYVDSTLAQVERAYKGQAQKDYESAGAQNPSDVKRSVLAGIVERGGFDVSDRQRKHRSDGYTSLRGTAIGTGNGRNLRNVWVIGKEPLKEAHFAAFPTKLVEPVIRLGTSEYGCCAQCYAPWTRNLIREAVPEHVQKAFEEARLRTVADTGRVDGHTARKPNYRRKVLGEGWAPTCDCGDGVPGRPIPTTVLDPFAGSGRAGVVAKRLGRSFIGIDANYEYCEIAKRVIDAT